MTRRWFKVSESRIYDLNIFTSFWIEERNKKFHVFGNNEDCEIIRSFKTFDQENDAKHYLEVIFRALEQSNE